MKRHIVWCAHLQRTVWITRHAAWRAMERWPELDLLDIEDATCYLAQQIEGAWLDLTLPGNDDVWRLVGDWGVILVDKENGSAVTVLGWQTYDPAAALRVNTRKSRKRQPKRRDRKGLSATAQHYRRNRHKILDDISNNLL